MQKKSIEKLRDKEASYWATHKKTGVIIHNRLAILLSLILVSCTHYHSHNSGTTTVNQYNNSGIGSEDPIYKSVAQIFVEHNNRKSAGAGFIIQNINNNSYLVTAGHVCVRRGKKITAHPVPDSNNFRETYIGKSVYVSKEDDVCIVRVYDTGRQFLPIKFAVNTPRTGDKVSTIGAAVGLFPTKTQGFIIGHDLLGMGGKDKKIDRKRYLLSSIPAAGGNSGGPIYNSNFKIVAMLVGNHKEFEHSSVSVHIETLKKHLKKYFKR